MRSCSLLVKVFKRQQTSTANFNAFLEGIKRNSKGDGGTASDQIRQRQAIISFDIPSEFGLTLQQSAERIRAKLLVIVSSQDHTVNPGPAEEFAAAINAPVVVLNSSCGHLSLSCISVGPIVARFLAKPESARSETLQDPVNR